MDRSMVAEFRPRDFIETHDGLVLAVVDAELEEGRLTAYLRYQRIDGQLRKLDTPQAKAYLDMVASDYVFYSKRRDTWVQAVPIEDIAEHYIPRDRLQEILTTEEDDLICRKLRQWCDWIEKRKIPLDCFGVTGSLLIGAQKEGSDLGVVCYDRDVFQKLREVTAELQSIGRLQPLTEEQWNDAYRRRSPALSYEEYCWHEQRKSTKALLGSTRLDLSLVCPAAASPVTSKKLGQVSVQARVTDDQRAFDFPSRWKVEHEIVREVICFSATYTGQVFQGEWMEAAGSLEMVDDGSFQLVVGANREAPEEFIRFLKH
jgi:predicted nucleotidyltransferase